MDNSAAPLRARTVRWFNDYANEAGVVTFAPGLYELQDPDGGGDSIVIVYRGGGDPMPVAEFPADLFDADSSGDKGIKISIRPRPLAAMDAKAPATPEAVLRMTPAARRAHLDAAAKKRAAFDANGRRTYRLLETMNARHRQMHARPKERA